MLSRVTAKNVGDVFLRHTVEQYPLAFPPPSVVLFCADYYKTSYVVLVYSAYVIKQNKISTATQLKQELSCCWDGRAMLYSSNSEKMGMRRSFWGKLGTEARVGGHELYNAKTRIFWLHFAAVNVGKLVWRKWL